MIFTLLSCQPEQEPPRQGLKVLTTIAPLYSFTSSIAGDVVALDNLIPSGTGPHEYALSPADARKVADADVLIMNGANLESWIGKLITSAGEIRRSGSLRKQPLVLIDTSDRVQVIDGDPHIWLSPRNAVIQVRTIGEALVKADPRNSETYKRNADHYIQRLQDLDREIRGQVLSWKARHFVTFHRAFGYFAREYGLEEAAIIQAPAESEPSPRHVAAIMNIIRENSIPVLYTEPQFSHKIVDSLARDMGLAVHALDTLETGELSPDWYEERMRFNLASLEKGLKGGSP